MGASYSLFEVLTEDVSVPGKAINITSHGFFLGVATTTLINLVLHRHLGIRIR